MLERLNRSGLAVLQDARDRKSYQRGNKRCRPVPPGNYAVRFAKQISKLGGATCKLRSLTFDDIREESGTNSAILTDHLLLCERHLIGPEPTS